VIYFTADTHFGHKNICKYCNRPFSSVEEMDESLIENWNRCVKPADTIYHLGDFVFGNAERVQHYLRRLNGNKIFVRGNHDSHLHKVVDARDVREIKVEQQYIFLSHYAHRVWDKSHHGSWHLYGHSHGTLPMYGNSLDVGVDVWAFAPVSFEQIKETFLQQPYHGEER